MRHVSLLLLLGMWPCWSQAAEGAPACQQKVPLDMISPHIKSSFPESGQSGHLAWLTLEVEHGKGESVSLRMADPAFATSLWNTLPALGFVPFVQQGVIAAKVVPGQGTEGRVKTRVEIPLILLPRQPGRNTLELPSLPLEVVRAGRGEAQLCTSLHRVVVEDPIASVPEAKPRPNPPPRPQRETWVALQKAIVLGLASCLCVAVCGWMVFRWRARSKPLSPPPPPRQPWEIALERLEYLAASVGSTPAERAACVDQVSDTVRTYLGARYGFDGLESTTDEILHTLAHGLHSAHLLSPVHTLLTRCDLIKFAKRIPEEQEVLQILMWGRHLVETTALRSAFSTGEGP